MSHAKSANDAQPATPSDRFPPQIKFIIASEGAERFSFYGMKNMLTVFLITYLLMARQEAESTYHLFVSACYFFPILGGYVADRFLGKYRTIFWLSIVYCLGNFCLAFFNQSREGFYVGLGLIALGSGGIKPCVSALVGDQFTEANKHLTRRVFAWFYWMINFGSFFATAIIPKTLDWFGPGVAFGIPGVLMAAATVLLWMGRHLYVDVPVVRHDPNSFSGWCGARCRAARRARGGSTGSTPRAPAIPRAPSTV